MEREPEIKEDGRYIVFYEFGDSGKDSGRTQDEGVQG